MIRVGPRAAALLLSALTSGLLAGCGTESASSTSASAPAPSSAAPAPGQTGASPAQSVPKRLAFKARTLEGAEFSGASLLGKPAVVWFWAPWCSTCRGEAPGVAEVAKRFEGKVAFLGIAGRDDVPEMRKFVDQEKLGFFPHVVDADGELWTSFGITGQPGYAFVGEDGKVEVVPASLTKEDLVAKTTELTA
jgi:thiol-disulfide isomerase/thioredoxin